MNLFARWNVFQGGTPSEIRDRRRSWERRLQTVVLITLVSFLGWLGKTLVRVDQRTAVIEERMNQTTIELSRAYPAVRAEYDQRMNGLRFDAVERRIDKLEQRTP